MEIRVLSITSFTYVFLFFCLLPSRIVAQVQSTESNSLLDKIVSVRMYDVYASQVLDFLSDEYNFPSGDEIARSQDDKKISVNIFQQPLRVALDAIVKADPDYRWELNDGVVNLIPKHDSGLLGIKIKSFQVRDMNRLETRRALAALPEVAAKINSLGLEFSDITVWRTKELRDQMRLTIDTRDTTLKDVLNMLAKKTRRWGISIWGEYVFIRI
jgi:hypothetical protein